MPNTPVKQCTSKAWLNRAATCSEQIKDAAEFRKPQHHLPGLQPKQASRPLRKT